MLRCVNFKISLPDIGWFALSLGPLPWSRICDIVLWAAGLQASQKKQIPDMGFQRAKSIQALLQWCDAGQAATRKVSSDRKLQYHRIVAAPVSDWSYSSSNSFTPHCTKIVMWSYCNSTRQCQSLRAAALCYWSVTEIRGSQWWFGWKLSSPLLSSYRINTSRESTDRFINIFVSYEN